MLRGDLGSRFQALSQRGQLIEDKSADPLRPIKPKLIFEQLELVVDRLR